MRLFKFKRAVIFVCSAFMMFCLPMVARAGNMFSAAPIRYCHVVIVGDFDGGKTSIWNRFIEESGTGATTRFVYKSRGLGHGNISLTVYDTPGMNEYRQRVVGALRGADYVFLVHDLCQDASDSRSYLDGIIRDIKSECCASSKLVLVGSKKDRRYSVATNYAENRNLLEALAKGFDSEFILSSAINDDMERVDPRTGKVLDSGSVRDVNETSNVIDVSF
jgi:small GTP-binding protein